MIRHTIQQTMLFARVYLRVYLLIAVCGGIAGCGIDTEPIAPSADLSKLIVGTDLEFRTYNLSTVAPYDTVTLKMRGISGTGTTLDIPPTFVYDTNYLSITPEGVLRAKAVVASTPVFVSMSSGGATRIDTIQVSVIGTVPRPLARVAVAPNPGDSAKHAVELSGALRVKRLQLIREDSSHASMPSVLVTLRVSDPTVAVATVSGNTVNVTLRRPGRVFLHTSAYAYGRQFRDSLEFIAGWPLVGNISFTDRYITGSSKPVIHLGFTRLVVGVGACVVWGNRSESLDVDILFDDPTRIWSPDSAAQGTPLQQCLSYGEKDMNDGNIAPFKGIYWGEDYTKSTRARAFAGPGVYTYRNSTHDFVGTIVVCDERNDPTCAPENYQWGTPEQ